MDATLTRGPAGHGPWLSSRAVASRLAGLVRSPEDSCMPLASLDNGLSGAVLHYGGTGGAL